MLCLGVHDTGTMWVSKMVSLRIWRGRCWKPGPAGYRTSGDNRAIAWVCGTRIPSCLFPASVRHPLCSLLCCKVPHGQTHGAGRLCHDACRRRRKIAMIQSLSINIGALLSAMPWWVSRLLTCTNYCGDTLGEDVQYMPVAPCSMIVEIGISRTWHQTS
jgi:hypothetical protein